MANRTAAFSLALLLTAGLAPVPVPAQSSRHIYSETANPEADIAAALTRAKHEHKRVLLDFGGDWCGDCQVLDIYLHQQPNQELLEKNYVFVHIFTTSTFDRNVELAKKYGVPLEKGVPAISVLDDRGNVIHAQQTGEFNDMRHMEAEQLTAFLNRWKA